MEKHNKYWWLDAVIYEVYVDKFAGNFKSFTEKLDYLVDLGINTIWLLPHYPSPMIDGGYDICDFKSVRDELGSINDFDNFIAEARKKGLRVIIDLVLNHTSDTHPWFLDARSSVSSPKRDWYLWSEDINKYSGAFVHFNHIKKTNWIRNQETCDYYYATFYPQQPDLNWDNPEVYKEMLDTMFFWLDRGVSGFRLDAVSRLVKRDGTNCFALPETHEIIKRMRRDVSIKYPDTLLLAESGGWPNEAKAYFGNGDECQLVLNFPFAANLLSAISTKDTSEADRVWNEAYAPQEICRWGLFLTNHDSVDLFFITDPEKKQKLGAQGGLLAKFGYPNSESYAARLAEICQGDKEKILWAFSKQMNYDGVPIIYYGNEIGMKNSEIPFAANDFREYVRGEFDWQDAQKQIEDKDSLLNKIKIIIKSKKSV